MAKEYVSLCFIPPFLQALISSVLSSFSSVADKCTLHHAARGGADCNLSFCSPSCQAHLPQRILEESTGGLSQSRIGPLGHTLARHQGSESGLS